jgi:hypothetical protein
LIEQLTGKEIISIAYPYGAVNEKIKSSAAKTGYKLGIATSSGPLKFYEDFFKFHRTQVFFWTNKYGFGKRHSSGT